MIKRLTQNVIKTGLRRINSSYSKIHFSDVARKLSLKEGSNIEFIIAKAIRDGVLNAKHKARLAVWMLHVRVVNDVHTDDNFQFAKATKAVKALVDALTDHGPRPRGDDDEDDKDDTKDEAKDEAAAGKDEDDLGLAPMEDYVAVLIKGAPSAKAQAEIKDFSGITPCHTPQ